MIVQRRSSTAAARAKCAVGQSTITVLPGLQADTAVNPIVATLPPFPELRDSGKRRSRERRGMTAVIGTKTDSKMPAVASATPGRDRHHAVAPPLPDGSSGRHDLPELARCAASAKRCTVAALRGCSQAMRWPTPASA